MFPGATGSSKFPDSSYLTISLNDITFMDVAHNKIAHKKVDITGKRYNEMTYFLNAFKPDDQYFGTRIFALSALIHVGWKRRRDIDDFIRPGDYHSTDVYKTLSKRDQDILEQDINVFCYGKCFFRVI